MPVFPKLFLRPIHTERNTLSLFVGDVVEVV